MICERTGCNVFIPQYNCFAHGDAYIIGGVRVFRLNPITFTNPNEPIQYVIRNCDAWFDQYQTSSVSTLVTADARFISYDGEVFNPEWMKEAL